MGGLWYSEYTALQGFEYKLNFSKKASDIKLIFTKNLCNPKYIPAKITNSTQKTQGPTRYESSENEIFHGLFSFHHNHHYIDI